jgi:RimJ/RimL family protein N-acetyltransferase
MIRNVTLAFRYSYANPTQSDCPVDSLCAYRADETLVESAYRDQPQIRDRFLSNLSAGCTGIMIMDGEKCVSRAWSSVPGRDGPHHLPRFVKSLGAYWIFCCATDERYRGRGLYKYCLQELIRGARAERSRADILIDTAAANLASRRAINSVGFEPRGVIVTYRFPKTQFVIGRWHMDKSHPSCQGTGAESEIAQAPPIRRKLWHHVVKESEWL